MSKKSKILFVRLVVYRLAAEASLRKNRLRGSCRRRFGIRIDGTQDLSRLDAARVVVVIVQRVDALGAGVAVAGIEALVEGVHARVNLQHAAAVAGRAWR